ncbi:MAG TPA: substrate-binding domain-containing protein [Planctomycetaceae bacterium]|nr:substrate-binding domain-containing protein [Planctomycetaceae bacterium]
MRLFSTAVLACAALLLVGCESGGQSSTGKSGGARYRIAVIPKGTTHEFWRAVHAGAAKAAKELGDTEILWKGPQLESDREGQIAVMQGFITKHVNGICLAPNDSQALLEYVDQAVQEKIPVVVFDSGLKDESKTVTFVATDNYKGGVLAARRMGEVLHGQGNAILLRYFPGSESTERREQGFLETMQKEFPKIVILSSDQYSGTTPEESLTKATQVLSKYKKDVNGLFAVCEPNATGSLRALEQTELDGKVAFIAFDPNDALIRGLAAKKVEGIVLQDPVKMGYEAVMSMHKHLQGEKVPKRIDTGSTVATPENMSEPRIQQLLKPDQYQD